MTVSLLLLVLSTSALLHFLVRIGCFSSFRKKVPAADRRPWREEAKTRRNAEKEPKENQGEMKEGLRRA